MSIGSGSRTGVMLLLSLAVGLWVLPSSSAAERSAEPVKTKRVSVNSAGVQGNGFSYKPSMSAGGRYVAFESSASTLVPGDTNLTDDVFVYDRQTKRTKRVSVSSSGVQGNDRSTDPSISSDGRFVAFHSSASTLVPGDTNLTEDVFVYDRQTKRTKRVSVSSAGAQGDDSSYDPSISADGRFVAFTSSASNLVGTDANAHTDVFVYDRMRDKAKLVSVSSVGAQGDNSSYDPSISADGRVVAFGSSAANLVGNDSNAEGDVFVRDRVTQRTKRVSVSSKGEEGAGYSYEPSVSATGRLVAFQSSSTLVRGDTNAQPDVFVYDRVTHETKRVSLSSARVQGDDESYEPAISGNGRFVAFTSSASTLVRGDTNARDDAFVHDRVTHETKRVSVSTARVQGNGGSYYPVMSARGRLVAFTSDAANLVRNDTNASSDIFVRGPLR